MSRILSIDQSICCTAYCIFENGELDDFGCIKTKKADGDLHRRCTVIAEELVDISCGIPTYKVIREGLAFGGSASNASRDLAYLVGMIECRLDGALVEVPPTSLKKFATGSGRAKKEDMISSLPSDVHQRFLDDGFKKSTGLADLADAYFLGTWLIDKGGNE